MLTVNREALLRIQLAENLVLEKHTLPKGTTLEKVIEFTIADKARMLPQAASILDAVMRTLDAQKEYVFVSYPSSLSLTAYAVVQQVPCLVGSRRVPCFVWKVNIP